MSQRIGNTTLAYARVWHHVDASDRVLGKLAERIALVLMGKHKPIYDPGGIVFAYCFIRDFDPKPVDCGDYVLVTNSRKVLVTGRKSEQLLYRKHSMYPGALKETPYKDMMEKNPDEIIRHAVSGMLPKNKLRERRLERLRIFPSYHMGKMGANVLRSWDDGTLPPDWDPSVPTTTMTLQQSLLTIPTQPNNAYLTSIQTPLPFAFFIMPPKASGSKPVNGKSAEGPKQKSLMTWFAKPQPKKESNASKMPLPPKTPQSKSPSLSRLNSSVPVSDSSPGLDSAKETPPTSDIIDIDMLSSEDEQRVRTTTRKRKIVYEESDDERSLTERSAPAGSSPTNAKQLNKKPRLSALLSDDEDDEVAQSASSSFSNRISRFKKSPVKKGRKSRSAASEDDDDFVVSDSDMDARSIKSSKSTSSLSRRSATSDDDEDDDAFDSEPVKKPAAKPKGRAKTITKNVTAGGGSFLTAAERQELERKNEKKEAESPYSFLQDVKDKDGNRPDSPNYDPRTLYVPRKAWDDFSPFEKQFWEIKQNHYDTVRSSLLALLSITAHCIRRFCFSKKENSSKYAGLFLRWPVLTPEQLYEDDARIGHQQFDLKLTSRVKMSMVGVPESSFDFWAAKFLAKGFKVGRVDQAETALGAEMRVKANKAKNGKAKDKIVQRELKQVYTNGTLIDPSMLTDDQAGHLISIREVFEEGVDTSSTFGISVLDCSTSQFNLSTFEDDICRTKMETLIRQLKPKELLFTKGKLSVSTTRLLKSIVPSLCIWTGLRDVEGFDYEQTKVELVKLYPQEEDDDGNSDGDELPASVPEPIRAMSGSQTAIESLGMMIWYLRQLNIDKDILSMKNFNVYDPLKRGQGLVLDGQSLAHIEVLLNNEGTEEGTLLKLLNRAVTPFGKRLFRIWLCVPLKEISDINARLDAVQDIMDNTTDFEKDFMDIAKGLPDLERIVSRIHAKNCTIRDFLKAFKKLSYGMAHLGDIAESFKSKTIFGLASGPFLTDPHVVLTLGEDASELVPQDGKDEVYDGVMAEIRELENELDDELKNMQKKMKGKLSWHHSSIGTKDIYLVETDAKQTGVPKEWTKTQSLKNKTRWVVPSIQPTVRKLKEARENRNTAIKAFRMRLFAEFDSDRSLWLRAVRIMAELDCLFSLAKASSAIGEPRCRPEFVEGESAWVDFRQLRHPTLCMNAKVESFIPNDVRLGGEMGNIALLTGGCLKPRLRMSCMWLTSTFQDPTWRERCGYVGGVTWLTGLYSGKSTVMRMTATGVIMAQLGMLVPAQSARLSPVDAILTRMGAYDNMFSNASTFKVELDECCKILRDATPKSLVILDELGRGTSTFDGMAIAGAVLHQLATHTLPLSIFATHYSSLTDDFTYHPNIRPVFMETVVDDEEKKILFLYKLVEGVAVLSFGTHVANLAGVPMNVVQRADAVSSKFAEQFKEKMLSRRQRTGRIPITAQADFAYLFGIATGKVAMPTNGKMVLAGLRKTIRRLQQ
ncbi:unnamed protein product [Mycena citricolor]|uniref:DNA mismatch repair protein n=1 Tax=Mycena citricolor TaxID=2018698 RepID=A0AAD2HQJ3_9AGAR|nr:unnamed protein product [Mycena citricolor]